MESYLTISVEEFEVIVKSFTSYIKEIDVRPLEMPMPMLTIVHELKNIPKTNALLVTHHKIPQLLLNDLASDNLKIYLTQVEENLVKLFFISV